MISKLLKELFKEGEMDILIKQEDSKIKIEHEKLNNLNLENIKENTDIDTSGNNIFKKWDEEKNRTLVPKKLVTTYLDEILILLIMNRGGACGRELTSDISHFFGVELSPGTVYPHLKELEHEGILQKQQKVKEKEYKIENSQEELKSIKSGISEILIFSLFMYLLFENIENINKKIGKNE